MKTGILKKPIGEYNCVIHNPNTFTKFEIVPIGVFLKEIESKKRKPLIFYIGNMENCNAYIQRYKDIVLVPNNNLPNTSFHVLHEIEEIAGEPYWMIHSLVQFVDPVSLVHRGLPCFIGFIEDIKAFAELHEIEIKLEGKDLINKQPIVGSTFSNDPLKDTDECVLFLAEDGTNNNFMIALKSTCTLPANKILFSGLKPKCIEEFNRIMSERNKPVTSTTTYYPQSVSISGKMSDAQLNDEVVKYAAEVIEKGVELLKNNNKSLELIDRLIELDDQNPELYFAKGSLMEVFLIFERYNEELDLKEEQ